MTNVIYSPLTVHGKQIPHVDIKATRVRWENIPSLPGFRASNMGSIKDITTNEILWPYKKKRYRYIRLNGKEYKVANLIAETFVPNPDNKPIANHKNGVKDWDTADNLEWATISENTSHAINELGYINNFGKRDVDVIKDGVVVFKARSVKEAARFVDGKSTHVSQVCKGLRNHHKGFIFKYAA